MIAEREQRLSLAAFLRFERAGAALHPECAAVFLPNGGEGSSILRRTVLDMGSLVRACFLADYSIVLQN
jgi:hypothetical protein